MDFSSINWLAVVVCVVVVDVVVVDLVPQDAKSNDVTKRKASEV